MWNSKITFLKAGMLTQFVDMGRPGAQAYGIPVSGSMDKTSALIANSLVNNPKSNPTIEISLLGPSIQFSGDAYIAITGADMDATIDGNSISMYETIYVASGSILSFGRTISGSKCYLAIAGKWQLPSWHGSVCMISGLHLDALKKNIIHKGFSYEIHNQQLVTKKNFDLKKLDALKSEVIRITIGPEFANFSSEQKEFLLGTSFSINNQSNKMAYKTNEYMPNYKLSHEMISSGIMIGTIQVSNAGQLIILLNDAGTTGGYPRIANIITADIPNISQMKSSDTFKFELVTIEKAQTLNRIRAELTNSLF